MANETRDAKLWASLHPETAYNTNYTAGADYLAMVSAEPIPGALPGIEKSDDADRTGTGTEFATHTCNQYWVQPRFTVSNDQDLFEGIFARLWARLFGGPPVHALVGVTGHKWTFELQHSGDSGRQLPATDLIFKNLVDDFLLAGLVCQSGSLGKSGADAPILAVDLLGSGKHTSPHAVAALPSYVAPTVCADGGLFIVKLTKADLTVLDLSALGCQFKTLDVAVNNNVQERDRCPGDAKLTQNTGTAAYVRRLLRRRTRDRLVPAFGFLLENLDVYKLMCTNETVTSVQIAVQGPAIPGGTANYELGVEIPKAKVVGISPQDFDGEQGYNAILQPIYDSVIDNGARGYVINTLATGFD